jgi:zinc protease
MTRLALAAFLALLTLNASALAGPEIRIADNVFLVPDPNAKAITLTMTIGAGCSDEQHGVCVGISHYLEHLLFLGRNPDHKAVSVAFFRDGVANGATSHLTTVYWDQFPARAESQAADLDKLFKYFTERLVGFEVSDVEAARERNVLLQEYRWRVASRASARFQTMMNAHILPDYPFAQQVAGNERIIAAYTVADARAFHDKWYAKNNAIFVVQGPLDAATVKAVAEKYLAPLPEKKFPERDWLQALRTFEPTTETLRVADRDVQRTSVEIEKVVRFEESDRVRTEAARSVLNTYLDGRFDGGPHDVLVEGAGLTDSVDGLYIMRAGAGGLWLTAGADPRDGVAPETMAKGFDDFLRARAAEGVPPETVERIKRRLIEDRALSEKDPSAYSKELTQWLQQRRSYQEFVDYSKNIAAVTRDDVNAILRAVAGPGREIVGVLTPDS